MFATDHQWYVDVGDLRYLRMATTANPSKDLLDEFPWMVIGKHKRAVRSVSVVGIIFFISLGDGLGLAGG